MFEGKCMRCRLCVLCRLTSDSADAQELLSAGLELRLHLPATAQYSCRVRCVCACRRLTSDSADAQESLSAELERSKASVARLLIPSNQP
jgi:hypothetical protein